MAEHFGVRPVRLAEQVAAAVVGVDRDVQVHGAARLALHRLGHEGGVDAVLQRHLAHQPLEHDHLVGQGQRVAVVEVDLQLGGAGLVDHGVQVQRGGLSIFVDGLDQLLVLVDRLQAVGLGRGLRPPRTPDRGGERQVGVGVDGGEVELQLRRHDGSPALGGIELQHRFQQAAGRALPVPAVGVVGVGEHEGGGRGVARRHAQGRGVGPQHHVLVAMGGGPGVHLRVVAGDGQGEDAGRQPQRPVAHRLQELLGREHLAANHPVHVGHQAFHLADPVFTDPGVDLN